MLTNPKKKVLPVVSFTNTIIHKRAMVIENQNTIITLSNRTRNYLKLENYLQCEARGGLYIWHVLQYENGFFTSLIFSFSYISLFSYYSSLFLGVPNRGVGNSLISLNFRYFWFSSVLILINYGLSFSCLVFFPCFGLNSLFSILSILFK